MERLEVEPPDTDRQVLRRANHAHAHGRFTARRLGVYAEVLRHEHHEDFARPTPYGRRVQKALCYKALHKLADGSVTLELLPGAGACTASLLPVDVCKETRSLEVKRFWSCYFKHRRTTTKSSVNSPLPTTQKLKDTCRADCKGYRICRESGRVHTTSAATPCPRQLSHVCSHKARSRSCNKGQKQASERTSIKVWSCIKS